MIAYPLASFGISCSLVLYIHVFFYKNLLLNTTTLFTFWICRIFYPSILEIYDKISDTKTKATIAKYLQPQTYSIQPRKSTVCCNITHFTQISTRPTDRLLYERTNYLTELYAAWVPLAPPTQRNSDDEDEQHDDFSLSLM